MYLYPTPPGDVELCESDLWGLVAPEDLFIELAIEKSRGVHVPRLRVLEAARDGLGVLRTRWKD
jgi:hypothetical protein